MLGNTLTCTMTTLDIRFSGLEGEDRGWGEVLYFTNCLLLLVRLTINGQCGFRPKCTVLYWGTEVFNIIMVGLINSSSAILLDVWSQGLIEHTVATSCLLQFCNCMWLCPKLQFKICELLRGQKFQSRWIIDCTWEIVWHVTTVCFTFSLI